MEIAIAAFMHIAEDPERVERFAALSGLDPAGMRDAARLPGFLPAVLDYFAGHEPDLLAFAAASGRPIPFAIAPRRPGDVARLYADPSRAEAALGWRAELGLADMCRSTWAWQSRNPQGYRDPGAAAG